jgi:aminoglycoside phosphotransferase (APT) family kinase protein
MLKTAPSSGIGAKDIEHLLKIAGIKDFTGHFTQLGGGEGNDTFMLECQSQKLILRVSKYDKAGNLYREANALSLLLSLKHVPKPVYFNESQRLQGRAWILETYLEGVPPDQIGAEQLENLGRLLAQVHRVRADKPERMHYWRHFLATQKPYGDEAQFLNHPDLRLRDLLVRAKSYFESQPNPTIIPALIHGDLSLENMLASGDEISLIDWEFSTFADPMADFATMFFDDSEQNKGRWRIRITPAQRSALFNGYTNAGGTVDEERLKAWQNVDKLGGAVYFYWKLKSSGHNLTQSKSAQYLIDLRAMEDSLDQNLG